MFINDSNRPTCEHSVRQWCEEHAPEKTDAVLEVWAASYSLSDFYNRLRWAGLGHLVTS